MTTKPYSSFTLVFKYLRYFLKAKSKYDIHSPFLFEFVTQVLNDKTQYPNYKWPEIIRQQFLKDNRVVEVEDLGAGSRVHASSTRKVSSIAKSALKSKKLARLLFRMAAFYKCKNTIELGTSLGVTSAYLAFSQDETNVYTIEGSKAIADLAFDKFRRYKIANVKAIQGSFDDKLPEVLSKLEAVDLVFIDGNHQYEPTLKYFELCLQKSHSKTIFVFDDIHWSPGMENAWEAIKKHSNVTLTVDLFFVGIVFMREGLSKEDYVLRF